MNGICQGIFHFHRNGISRSHWVGSAGDGTSADQVIRAGADGALRSGSARLIVARGRRRPDAWGHNQEIGATGIANRSDFSRGCHHAINPRSLCQPRPSHDDFLRRPLKSDSGEVARAQAC